MRGSGFQTVKPGCVAVEMVIVVVMDLEVDVWAFLKSVEDGIDAQESVFGVGLDPAVPGDRLAVELVVEAHSVLDWAWKLAQAKGNRPVIEGVKEPCSLWEYHDEAAVWVARAFECCARGGVYGKA